MGYYDWQQRRVPIGDLEIFVATKAGLPDTLIAEQLLAAAVSVQPGERVLDLRCATGLVGAALLKRGAAVALFDDHVVAVEATKRTLALNGLPTDLVFAGEPTVAATCDVALINAPKGREAGRRLLQLAVRALRPGGRLFVAGANHAGVKSLIDAAGQLIGALQVIKIKASHRVAVGVRGASIELPDDASDDAAFVEHTATVRGQVWRYVSRPGVFAWDHLDDGSRVLIETLHFQGSDRVLDLGCGSGLIGLVASTLANRVVSVDASTLAVEATRRTYELNRVGKAKVLLSDCASAVFDRQFDVVATNPPFHQGVGTDYAVAKQFVIDAARVLTPGGQLWLVANRFLRYENELADRFAEIRVAYEDNRYRVLMGVKQ